MMNHTDAQSSATTKLLVATTNPGKLVEYQALLGDLPVELLYLRDVNITDEIPETGTTFEANALIKAEGYARISGIATLADDSGLEVDALNGEPGVYSARYGDVNSDSDRTNLVLTKLKDVPTSQRSARFVCVIVIALPGGTHFEARGTIEGTITDAPRGTNGFGYDPIFGIADDTTMAELSPHEKNRISHRAQATHAIRPQIETWLASISS